MRDWLSLLRCVKYSSRSEYLFVTNGWFNKVVAVARFSGFLMRHKSIKSHKSDGYLFLSKLGLGLSHIVATKSKNPSFVGTGHLPITQAHKLKPKAHTVMDQMYKWKKNEITLSSAEKRQNNNHECFKLTISWWSVTFNTCCIKFSII
jgi:hypothetical protein